MNYIISEEELINLIQHHSSFQDEIIDDFLKSKQPVEEIADTGIICLNDYGRPYIEIFNGGYDTGRYLTLKDTTNFRVLDHTVKIYASKEATK